MKLRRPALADKAAVLALVAEFEQSQSAHDGGFWNPGDFCYETWLKGVQDGELGLNLPDGWVPAIQLVGFEGKKAVGFLNLRLALNDHLLQFGGHIGYSVRPTERNKGYAKAMLKQAFSFAISRNIKRVLVICHVGNSASRAVILANGGVLEDVREGTERYWIALESKDGNRAKHAQAMPKK